MEVFKNYLMLIFITCELKVCTIMKPENPIDYLVLPATPELWKIYMPQILKKLRFVALYYSTEQAAHEANMILWKKIYEKVCFLYRIQL